MLARYALTLIPSVHLRQFLSDIVIMMYADRNRILLPIRDIGVSGEDLGLIF